MSGIWKELNRICFVKGNGNIIPISKVVKKLLKHTKFIFVVRTASLRIYKYKSELVQDLISFLCLALY